MKKLIFRLDVVVVFAHIMSTIESPILTEIFHEYSLMDSLNIIPIIENYIYEPVCCSSSNGFYESQYTLRFGVKHGDFYEYVLSDENNKRISIQCTYYDGKLHGVHRSWVYIQGVLYEETHYVYNQKHGIYQKWYTPNQKYIECTYKHDKLDGVYKSWYYNGILNKECMYEDGQLHGKYKEWDENGRKTKVYNYKYGEKSGQCTDFPKNGNIHVWKF